MTYLVGVGGGSGSGKGTITDLIQLHLEKWGLRCHILTTDDCYHNFSHLTEQERDNLCFNPDKNYDHPSSIDFVRLLKFSQDLKNGQPFSYLTYNFKTHTYDADSVAIDVPENLDVAIVEGNYALYSDSGAEVGKRLVNLYDHKLFVTTDPLIAQLRRIERDIKERGRAVEHIVRQLRMTVIPMYKRFIYPTHLAADDVVNWDVDPSTNSQQVKDKLIKIARQRALVVYEDVRGALRGTDVTKPALVHCLDELKPEEVALDLPEYENV